MGRRKRNFAFNCVHLFCIFSHQMIQKNKMNSICSNFKKISSPLESVGGKQGEVCPGVLTALSILAHAALVRNPLTKRCLLD